MDNSQRRVAFARAQKGILDIKVSQILNIFYFDYNPNKTTEEIENMLKKIWYKISKIRNVRDTHTK